MRKKTKLYYFEEFVSYYNQQKFSNVTKSVILDLDSKWKIVLDHVFQPKKNS